MIEVKLSLTRVLSDRAEFFDWSTHSLDEVISHLAKQYSFLGGDTTVAVEKNVATMHNPGDGDHGFRRKMITNSV